MKNFNHKILISGVTAVAMFINPILYAQTDGVQDPQAVEPVPQEVQPVPPPEVYGYEEPKKMTRREKRKERRREAGGGMAAGALAGAALGAMVGEAGYGAAMGAAVGGAYTYDQRRQDERMELVAGAIAQPNVIVMPQQAPTQAVTPAPAPAAQITVGEIGRQNLSAFTGDWDVELWVLTKDGDKLTGSGSAKGLMAGESGVRVLFTQFDMESFPEATGGGQVRMSYEEGEGFFLESSFAYTDEVLKMVGEFVPDSNKYNFYLLGAGGENAAGIVRSSVRVEVRSAGAAVWFAETYTIIDGVETQIQSYIMTRRL